MTLETPLDHGYTEKPTGRLRFLKTANARMLQQEWLIWSDNGGYVEWRDVPLETE